MHCFSIPQVLVTRVNEDAKVLTMILAQVKLVNVSNCGLTHSSLSGPVGVVALGSIKPFKLFPVSSVRFLQSRRLPKEVRYRNHSGRH